MKLIEIHSIHKNNIKIGETKQKIDMQKFPNSSAQFTLVFFKPARRAGTAGDGGGAGVVWSKRL